MVYARLLSCLLLTLATVMGAIPANACITFKESDEDAFLEADLIFVGDLTDYEIVTAKDGYVDDELAILTYRVDEVLKGEAADTIRLWWPNSTFGLPESMSRYGATLVAVDQSAAAEVEWTGWLHYPSRNAITRLPRVHQPPCGSESIIPVAPNDIATVKRWVVAGKADGTELSYDSVKVGELPARHTAQWNLLPYIGGAVGAGALILAINRRRRRRKRDRAPAG